MLTPEQNAEILRLKPQIERMAVPYNKRTGDDEYTGVALLALCEAVHKYDATKGLPLDEFVRMKVSNTLNDTYTREKAERNRGLRGGSPTRASVEAQRSQRYVTPERTSEGQAALATTDMDQNFVARDARDPDCLLRECIEELPYRLRQIALARWIDKDPLYKIAKDEEMTIDQVRYALEEAKGFAKLHLDGGDR